MLGQLRRVFRPTRASGPKPVSASRALHTAISAGANEQVLHCKDRLSLTLPELTFKLTASDPYVYTTGRWLDQDRIQCEARHVKFDFAALCAKAVKVCTGATKVVRYEKKEGGFNRVFLLSMDNGARVVARVPYRIAGPRRLTTNSEVATMAYGMAQSVQSAHTSTHIF
jgi:hypothetical protein